MGRIKTIAVKKFGNELIEKHGHKFTADFEKNKKALAEVETIDSKRTRNVVAGYITTYMKKQSAQK